MKRTLIIMLVLTGIVLTGIVLTSCSKDDTSKFHYKSITEVDTLHTSIAYENEYIQVVDVELHPGETIPTFTSGGRLIYSLSDYKITVIENEIKTEKDWKFGDIHWHDLSNFSLENNDTADVKFSIIKRTEKALPETDTTLLEKDVTTHSDHSVVLLENDQLKVVQVTLATGDSIPQHAGINRLYIPQTDYNLICQIDQVGDLELNHKIGDFRFFNAGSHGMKNVGETEAVYLLISFKK